MNPTEPGGASEGPEAARKLAVKALIERYYYQLTDGCGRPNCTNENCASSKRLQPLSPNEAAARALQLFMTKAQLCERKGSSNHIVNHGQGTVVDNGQCKTKPVSDGASSMSLGDPVSGVDPSGCCSERESPVVTRDSLMSLIEECRRANNYTPLIHTLGQAYSREDCLKRSFPKQPSEAVTKEDIRAMEVDMDKDQDCQEMQTAATSTAKSSVSEEITVDVESVREAYTALFSIPGHPFSDALVNAILILCGSLEIGLKYHGSYQKDPSLLNIFVILMELPLLEGTFCGGVLPALCRACDLLPAEAHCRLVRHWAHHLPPHRLRTMVNALHHVITTRVIEGHFGHEFGISEDTAIALATKMMKLLYMANVLGGELEQDPFLGGSTQDREAGAGGKDILDMVVAIKEDPLWKELGVKVIDCRRPLIPFEDFCNEPLSEYLETDQGFAHGRTKEGPFSFLNHAFVLTPAAKALGLYYDNRIRMYSERNLSVIQMLVGAPANPYLRLNVRRDHIIDDALYRLEMLALENPSNLKKQLVVEFDGQIPMVRLTESAIDRRNLPKKTAYPQPPRNEEAHQKDRLTEQLMQGDYECMVCCERVKGLDPVWSCSNCYHIYHLQCVRKWATSPAALVKEGGWRCPACQHATKAVPQQYYCFCGKRTNPEWNRFGVPHGCGDVCGRSRGCVHRCTLQCHPGPCPPCAAMVQRPCHCGRLVRCVRCSQEQDLSCGERCGQPLNCRIHSCEVPCHAGSCKPCDRIVTQRCYCGKKSQEVTCTRESNVSSEYSCEEPCGRSLACGNHSCTKQCHFGECGDCPRLPSLVVLCPCGQTPLSDIAGAETRTSCTDPIPLCGKTCGKELPCGPMENPHRCSAPCHEGPCPDCQLTTVIRCRCGGTSRDVPCVEAAVLEEQTCQRRCQKRRQCGRHKCLAACCVDTEHRCPLTCGKRLSCGLHVCQEPCHCGNCPTCWNVSFEDLTCHCGSTSLSPPIPCGTRPPECNQPCARSHPCGHPVSHTCHSDDFCPPCPALTEKWCYGKHEKRKAVPCFLEGLSCGLVCGKELSCGQHRCQRTCHAGPCLSGETCDQPCPKPRPSCGHPCAEPCHVGPCATTPCKATVTITCACGHRSERVSCGEGGPTYNQLSASVLATKIQGIQLGESVDIGEVMALSRTKPSKLECNEECAVYERNRRLAAALHIHNADLSNRAGAPAYSDFLKEEARKNPSSVASAYHKLMELVQTAKQSKQKCRSHSFPAMTRERRRLIHELAELFGCETQSYDCEPYRNVVVTAYKDKCHIPCTSLMSVVQREMGQRRGPVPLSMPWRQDQQTASALSALTSANPTSMTSNHEEAKPAGPDYFNFT